MIKYDSYKDSGVEWIGEIPEHWEVKKLKRLAKIGNGQDHKKVWDDNGDYPIIGTGGAFGKANNYLHKGPSVILGRKGTIDKPQFIESPFWSVDTAYYTEINQNVHPKLFYYLCTTINFDLHKYGSAVPSMTQEVLSQIPFVIPNSVEEQSAIAHYLDRKTAEIDELIANKKRLLELYDEEKTSIINQAVTKGINSKVPMKDSGIEWLRDSSPSPKSIIPKHWKVKRLKYIIKGFESGVSVNSLDNPILEGQYGILKTSCVYDYTFRPDENKLILNQSELKRARINPKKGMIIISRMNTPDLVGASGYVDKDYPHLFLPDRLWQTIFHSEIKIDSKWLSFVLKSMSFRKLLFTLATGTSPSMKNIGQEEVLNVPIPFPGIEEQLSIVDFIETECDRIAIKKSKTEKLIELLTEYRTALISEVVTGKVRVT